MKIAIVCYPTWGGSGVVATELGIELAGRGHEIHFITYKQPVTRGDIEDIRADSVSSNILRALEARGWIDIVGHKESPGRPALFSTTRAFLDDLNLRSLDELPPLEELGMLVEAAGGEPEEATESVADEAAPVGDRMEEVETDVTDSSEESALGG